MIIPLEAGLERVWMDSTLVIAPHHWQLTEQLPGTIFIQSTARKRQPEKTILGMTFRFITVVEAKFFGVLQRTLNGQALYVTDREKTLVDAADHPELSGGLLQLAQALQTAQSSLDWPQLDDYLQRWPNTGPLKRLGYLVETLALSFPDREERLARWQGALSPGIVALEPGTGAETGRVVTRWQLRVNVAGPWSAEAEA